MTIPLPEPAGVIIVGTQALRAFTADQLRAYGDARAAERDAVWRDAVMLELDENGQALAIIAAAIRKGE